MHRRHCARRHVRDRSFAYIGFYHSQTKTGTTKNRARFDSGIERCSIASRSTRCSKSVILVLCTSLVIILALGAWDSWQRVNTANRIAAVADASTHIFKALHNLRSDRSRTVSDRAGGEAPTPPTSHSCRKSRDAEVPALEGGAWRRCRGCRFPDQPAMVSELDQRLNTLMRLHTESLAAAAAAQERAACRSLPRRSSTNSSAFITFLDRAIGSAEPADQA